MILSGEKVFLCSVINLNTAICLIKIIEKYETNQPKTEIRRISVEYKSKELQLHQPSRLHGRSIVGRVSNAYYNQSRKYVPEKNRS
jgi:hypothetical protein